MGERQHHRSIDLLHPLISLDWGENKLLPGRAGTAKYANLGKCQCVLIHEAIYVTMEYDRENHDHDIEADDVCGHCASTADLGSWTPFSVPAVRSFALTTYHSQLVMVGGWTDGKKVSGTLWASTNGSNWQETLPPMPTSRYGAAVVNTGSSGGPECLVVAGGVGEAEEELDTVELLREGQWYTVNSLPEPNRYILQHNHFVLHNGTVVLGVGHNKMCPLYSLVAKNQGCSASLWKEARFPISGGLTSFRGYLVCFDLEMLVYSPPNQAWVNMGEIPGQEMEIFQCLASPTGTLIVLGRLRRFRQVIVKEVAFRVILISVLYIAWSWPKFQWRLNWQVTDRLAEVLEVKEIWRSGRSWTRVMHLWQLYSPRLLTWSELYEVLRELGLEELSQQIEDYLSCPRSLMEQCTSAIMCALLQQCGSLKPEQLHVRLPDYVPTTVKHTLTHTFKAHTLQLQVPTPRLTNIEHRV